MIKGFRKYLKENVIQETFNSFVEECFGGGQIDTKKAQTFITEQDYLYSGDSYRVIWAPTQDIINQKTFKNIARYISNKFLNDASLYKFFYKSVEHAFASKIYVKNTENKTGIIFQFEAKNALDLTKYTGENEGIKERINDTNTILFFEPLNINTITGKIIFDQYTNEGWTLVTYEESEDDIDKEILKNKDDDEVTPEEKPKSKKKDVGPAEKTKKGISKFPH